MVGCLDVTTTRLEGKAMCWLGHAVPGSQHIWHSAWIKLAVTTIHTVCHKQFTFNVDTKWSPWGRWKLGPGDQMGALEYKELKCISQENFDTKWWPWGWWQPATEVTRWAGKSYERVGKCTSQENWTFQIHQYNTVYMSAGRGLLVIWLWRLLWYGTWWALGSWKTWSWGFRV